MKNTQRTTTKLLLEVADDLAWLAINMLVDHFGIPREVVVILEMIFELLKLWHFRARPAQSQRHQ